MTRRMFSCRAGSSWPTRFARSMVEAIGPTAAAVMAGATISASPQITQPLAAVLRQDDGTTLPPAAWDHLPGVSALVGPMMLAGVRAGQLRRRRRGRGAVVARARPGFWRCRSCRRRGRARRRRTGGGRWRTGREGRRPSGPATRRTRQWGGPEGPPHWRLIGYYLVKLMFTERLANRSPAELNILTVTRRQPVCVPLFQFTW